MDYSIYLILHHTCCSYNIISSATQLSKATVYVSTTVSNEINPLLKFWRKVQLTRSRDSFVVAIIFETQDYGIFGHVPLYVHYSCSQLPAIYVYDCISYHRLFGGTT